MKMQSFVTLLAILFLSAACTDNKSLAQGNAVSGKKVGGSCEGCEAIYENKIPIEELSWELTLPAYNETGPKLEIFGTVFKADGKTPAAGVIMYVYHTDQGGQYPKKGDETGWDKRHGYLRGWIKTNVNGQYRIKTLKPASYPNSRIPAHIHCIIKEPQINEYYIDDFLFNEDPFITESEKKRTDRPGGNGIIKLTAQKGILTGKRDIYLGRNVENYPL